MRAYLPFFLVFAALWVLQLYATAKQGQHFMREVARLRPLGETAIGASSHSRLRRRSYVALASDETDLVTGAIELTGVTVFARASDVPELVGRPLAELAAAPDGDRRSDAARMAARALLGQDLDGSSTSAVTTTSVGATSSASRSSHLPSATGSTGVRDRRERGS